MQMLNLANRRGLAQLGAVMLLSVACSDQAAPVAVAAKVQCPMGIDGALKSYREKLADKYFAAAASALEECLTQPNVPADFKDKIREASTQRLIHKAADPKQTQTARLLAMEALAASGPEFARTYGPQVVRLKRQMEKEAEATRAAERKERRRHGVSLGMTDTEVLQSSWGRPERVNRSINSYGVREQWVYSGGYLYFKDGVLETIHQRTSR